MIQLSTVRMTSPLEIQIVGETETRAVKKRSKKAFKKAIDEVDRLSALLSEYDKESEISRINRNAGKAKVTISPETAEVVDLALKIAQTTSGAFDPTFRPLLNLWDYNKEHTAVPSPPSIQKALSHVDFNKVELDRNGLTVRLMEEEMLLGMGGVSKGYIVQAMADVLKSFEFQNFLINAGGDIFASGTHLGESWKVGVPDPLRPKQMAFSVPVSNAAFCTSACYERYVDINDKRFGHILNPKTGFPVEYTKGVSVIARKMAYADAIATTIFVLGPSEGLAFANHLSGTEAIIFDGNGEMSMTQGLMQSVGAA